MPTAACADTIGIMRDIPDGVERDAGKFFSFLQAALQGFLQMPADRLALTIRVGGKDQGVVGLQRLGNGADVLFRLGRDLPQHVEAVLGIDRAILGRQVTNMTVGRKDDEVRAKIFVDCLGLGGGFDDDDWHIS